MKNITHSARQHATFPDFVGRATVLLPRRTVWDRDPGALEDPHNGLTRDQPPVATPDYSPAEGECAAACKADDELNFCHIIVEESHALDPGSSGSHRDAPPSLGKVRLKVLSALYGPGGAGLARADSEGGADGAHDCVDSLLIGCGTEQARWKDHLPARRNLAMFERHGRGSDAVLAD